MATVETSEVQNLLANLQKLTYTFRTELKDNIIGQTLIECLEEIAKRGESQSNEAVSELEQAKLLNLNAYLLVSLYFTHLKVKGDKLDPSSPVISEINRVKEFMDKVKVAETQLLQREENRIDQTKEANEFIQKHYNRNNDRTPAVSKVHFESKKSTLQSGTHMRFDEKNERQQATKSLKANRTKTHSATKVTKGTSRKPRKGKM